MKRRSTSLNPISSISLTSMMDVTFNLLIAFMIVAPSLKHGLKLDLPEVQGASIQPRETITVYVRTPPQPGEDVRIYLDDRRVPMDELTEKLMAMYERNPDVDVLIESDKTIAYEIIARVLQALQTAGVTNVGLVTDPPSER